MPKVSSKKTKKSAIKVRPSVRKEDYNTSLSRQVLKKLGRPKHLAGVKVHNVFANRYRVNVEIDKSEGLGLSKDITVPHTYFVYIDSNGEIIKSVPEIVKTYEV